MWLRVECYNNSGDKVDVKCIVNDGATPTEQNWADATVYFRQTNFTNIAGGRVGFAIGSVYIDDLTIKSDADGDGEFTNDSTTEAVEDFTETSGDASDKLVHDAAGNLTYDGKYEYAYDAWNRMVAATRAWQGGGEGKTGSAVATIAYDGANRRVSKMIDNSGDWNYTYNFYHDGQSMIETRNGSGEVIKQHVWGTQYVDEIIQIGINTNPGEDDDGGEAGMQDNCDEFYWTAQDANYNVIGLFESDGDLVERYEYTPYGQRTVFRSAGSDDKLAMAPILESQRVDLTSGGVQPYGICDIGHQGLMHDKEFGLIYVRARYLQPILGIYTGPDLYRYVDGMNYFEYVRSNPIVSVDPTGTRESNCRAGCCPNQKDHVKHTETVNKEIRKRLVAAWDKAKLPRRGTGTRPPLTPFQEQLGWERFVKEIWATMAGNDGAIDTKIEKWLNKNKDLGTKGPVAAQGLNQDAPCIAICDTCIGTDKLGHMFQQGYMMFVTMERYIEMTKDGGTGSTRPRIDVDRKRTDAEHANEAFYAANALSLWTEGLYTPKTIRKKIEGRKAITESQARSVEVFQIKASMRLPERIPGYAILGVEVTDGVEQSFGFDDKLKNKWGGKSYHYPTRIQVAPMVSLSTVGKYNVIANVADHNANMQGLAFWQMLKTLKPGGDDGSKLSEFNICDYIKGKKLEDPLPKK